MRMQDGSSEQVAPCFPGATLESTEGDSFTGTVKVKLGPISLTYKGKGTFVERDEANHKLVIDAQGRETLDPPAALAGALLPLQGLSSCMADSACFQPGDHYIISVEHNLDFQAYVLLLQQCNP